MKMWTDIGSCSSVRNHTPLWIRFRSNDPTLPATYNYRPEDIVVLKDLPKLPKLSHPTRVNMVRDIRPHLPALCVEIQPRFVS
jgi:hypothetical protein